MTAGAASPVDEVVELLRQLRLPHMRRTAPDLLATAKAQRWDPAEAVRALLVEELSGRQRSSIGARRRAAGFPTGKTFEVWDETISSIPAPTQRALRSLEWLQRHENIVVCGPSGTGKSHCETGSTGPARTGARLVPVARRDPKTHWLRSGGCLSSGSVRRATGAGPDPASVGLIRSLSTHLRV